MVIEVTGGTLATVCMGNGDVCEGHEGGPGVGGGPGKLGHDGGRARRRWRRRRGILAADRRQRESECPRLSQIEAPRAFLLYTKEHL